MVFRLKQFAVALLISAILVLTGSPLAPTARAYTDDAGHWAAPVIEKAGAYGLMQGYPDGRFGVGDDISRGEFVTVLCRMFGWEPVSPEEPTFPDCPAKKWFTPYVEAAAANGVLDLDLPFRPVDPISREEMAVMLVRALGLGSLAQSLTNPSLPFVDVTENLGYVALAYAIGMTSGVRGADGTLYFLPQDSAPREQAAAMVVRVYERWITTTDWLHGFYAFSSYSQIDLTDSMDGVSVGWARLDCDSDLVPWINSTKSGGNDWVMPTNPAAALERWQANGLPYNLNVYADTSKRVTLPDGSATSVLDLILTDPQAAGQAIQALVAVSADYAGLTIDFEGLRSAELKEPYAQFMSDLRSALPQDKTLYVCVPPDTWYSGYDYRSLGDTCDKVILMAHDYQWLSVPEAYVGLPKTYSPVTPLPHIFTALQHITDPDTGVRDKTKLAIQISFGTAGLHVDEDGCLLDTSLYHPAPSTIAQRLTQEDSVRVWDEESHNPCLAYTVNGEHYRLWYEDAQSVADKLFLARMFGVTGVSIWRLGTIPNYPEIENYDVWSVFERR